jgi:hypothetical protein
MPVTPPSQTMLVVRSNQIASARPGSSSDEGRPAAPEREAAH